MLGAVLIPDEPWNNKCRTWNLFQTVSSNVKKELELLILVMITTLTIHVEL